jgi:hypothetical protein
VIREWQGDKTVPGEPTLHATKHKSVLQRPRRRRRSEDNGLISVGAAKSLEPTRRMEDRRPWMSIDKIGPSSIMCRIELVATKTGDRIGGASGQWILQVRCAERISLGDLATGPSSGVD